MLPALLMVGFGRTRRFWIPLPFFLLWPIWLLGWAVWGFSKIVGFAWEKSLRTALMVGAHLSGARVEIDTTDGNHIHFWMV
jgi:hypothetical protein